MAEQRKSNTRSSSKSGGTSRSRNDNNKKLTGREAVEQVRSELVELMGRPIAAVLGLESDDGNGWRVTVEVVELERIPHSTDVLGAYEVTLDDNGELTGYKRQRRYYRNQADEG